MWWWKPGTYEIWRLPKLPYLEMRILRCTLAQAAVLIVLPHYTKSHLHQILWQLHGNKALLEEWLSGWVFLSLHLVNHVTNFCLALLSRDIQYSYSISWHVRCQYLWKKQSASERYPRWAVWSYSGSALQTKSSWVSYREGRRVCENQATRSI